MFEALIIFTNFLRYFEIMYSLGTLWHSNLTADVRNISSSTYSANAAVKFGQAFSYRSRALDI